jgi:hypothetical protein
MRIDNQVNNLQQNSLIQLTHINFPFHLVKQLNFFGNLTTQVNGNAQQNIF